MIKYEKLSTPIALIKKKSAHKNLLFSRWLYENMLVADQAGCCLGASKIQFDSIQLYYHCAVYKFSADEMHLAKMNQKPP